MIDQIVKKYATVFLKFKMAATVILIFCNCISDVIDPLQIDVAIVALNLMMIDQ